MTQHTARGRPLASSQEALQDAAFELFLENSYAKTTIEHITQRAGVSRATFFNYFPAKSDVFWVDLDQALVRLQEELPADVPLDGRTAEEGLEQVQKALVAVASELGTNRVPFALTQHELVGSVHELQASALARFSFQANIITSFLEGHGLPPSRARAAAYGCIAAAVSGAQEWAASGTTRAPLETYLRAAVDPVIAGFAARGT